MASRENQGLHIALILLVMVTVLLCVASYFLYSRGETQRGRADEATKKLATVTADRDKALNTSQKLQLMIRPNFRLMRLRKLKKLLRVKLMRAVKKALNQKASFIRFWPGLKASRR